MIKPKYVQGRRPGDDHIYQEVMSGIYTKYFSPGTGDIVLDVGAHAGFFTGIASMLVGGHGEVWAFEPEPDNYALLKEIPKVSN